MITAEDQQLQNYLAIGEVTFGIPAQSFAISCAFSSDELLPVVTEFALRIIYACGSVTPQQLKGFFGYSDKETNAVVTTLLEERLIHWHDEQLELSPYAADRFLSSSDNLPRFTKIQEWSTDVVFDLISFNPAARGSGLKRSRPMVELTPPDPDKVSRTIHWAERSFEQNFSRICQKNNAQIYKISEVEPGEHFTVPLPCTFHLNFEGPVSIRRDIDDANFGQRREIAEAITDAMAIQERRQNDHLENFIEMFDDEVLRGYCNQEKFDLKQYVMDVHLAQTVHYSLSHVTPIFGSLHLPRNSLRLLEWVKQAQAKLETDEQSQDDAQQATKTKQVLDACWLAPNSRLWSRSRAAKVLVSDLNKALSGQAKDGTQNPVHRVKALLQLEGERKDQAYNHMDTFGHLYWTPESLMNGDLELFLLPGHFVCALYHFHLPHNPISVPIGFLSTAPHHLATTKEMIVDRLLKRGKVQSMSKAATQQDTKQAFSFLLPNIMDNSTS